MALKLEKRGDLVYFVPENIKTAALFTTRLGGVSGNNNKNSPLYNLNLGIGCDYDTAENVGKNYKIIADTLGFSVNNIIYAHQRHTDNILICDENFFVGRDVPGAPRLSIPDGFIYDAMVANISGILLSVRTADCVPVLFWDEEYNAIGAAHCGWRGTLNKLQIKTALKMREVYKINLKNLKAALGPCISKCCYEVSEDFYVNFKDVLGERVKIYFREKSGGKYMCDLRGINKMLLLDLLDENNIEVSENCTYCEEDLFYSHRRQGERRGTHAAFIGKK